MAWEQPNFNVTFPASADLKTKQFYVVRLATDGQVEVCTSATERPLGILQNKPDAADVEANVMIIGVSKFVADAAVSVGAALGTSADGQVVTKTGSGTDGFVIGTALEASAQAGDIITGLFIFAPHQADSTP